MAAMFGSNTLVTGGTFVQNHDNRQVHTSKGNLDRLVEATSPTAFHNSMDRYDPPKCHPNTRVAVLQKIKDWILSLDPETRSALIMWVNGPAGAGKSAIGQSIAEWAFEEGLLFASYFFSRSDSTRNHPRSLIATIAYQAASYSSNLRDLILAAVAEDPLIFTRSLMTQLRKLIIDPLRSLITSGNSSEPLSRRLIIIDGLDECDRAGQTDILRTISEAIQNHNLPLIFLVASRPEYDITHLFGLGYLRESTSRLPLDDKYQPSSDIKLFLQHEFNEIKQNHPLKAQIAPEWPVQKILDQLVKKSSGQFIYAATVIKFVKSTRHRPFHRLDIVLGLRPTGGSSDLPFSELDALYHHVFTCVQDIKLVLKILAFQILRPLEHDVSYIERILSLNLGDIELLFCDLQSIVGFEPFPYEKRPELQLFKLHFHHASLPDFLLDESRSKELYIDAPMRHAEFAQALFPYFPQFASGFDLQVCAYHLKRALPSEELRRGILGLDITGFFRLPPGSEVLDVLRTVGQFLESIKQSSKQFIDADNFHRHHSQAVDEYIGQQLGSYYSVKGLAALIAVISISDRRPIELTTASFNTLFELDEKSTHIDIAALRLIPALTDNIPKAYEYYDFLHTMFSHKTRLGSYVPTTTVYTNSAIHLLKRIIRHLELKWPWDNENVKMWAYGLDCLAKLLKESRRSETLIDLAQRCNFSMIPDVLRHGKTIVAHEVGVYLQRMCGGRMTGPEFQSFLEMNGVADSVRAAAPGGVPNWW